MSNKHITIKELNNEGVYDTLYPNTSATQVPLSAATSQLFGQTGLNTDAALYKIIEKLRTDKKITVRVTDSNGNPVQGAKINGLLNSPTTSANGVVTGVFVSDPLTIISPYVDVQDGTANGADYVGTINVLEVVLQAEADNTIFRYTSSTNVKFSPAVSTIDVCCVGGGGGGGGGDSSWSYAQVAGGGGGGGIVNSLGISVDSNQSYQVIVATGGAAGTVVDDWSSTSTDGHTGGQSKFGNLVTANGGEGGYYLRKDYAGGAPGAPGCGTGGTGADIRTQDMTGHGTNGTSNTTISEFGSGLIFYSGGGGSGGANGGSPNGANGARYGSKAPSAGIGGGGGGGYKYVQYDSERPIMGEYLGSSGGNGLVAIRIHLK